MLETKYLIAIAILVVLIIVAIVMYIKHKDVVLPVVVPSFTIKAGATFANGGTTANTIWGGMALYTTGFTADHTFTYTSPGLFTCMDTTDNGPMCAILVVPPGCLACSTPTAAGTQPYLYFTSYSAANGPALQPTAPTGNTTALGANVWAGFGVLCPGLLDINNPSNVTLAMYPLPTGWINGLTPVDWLINSSCS
jgi:hypothetical protein